MTEYTSLKFDYSDMEPNKRVMRNEKQLIQEKEPEHSISFEDKYYKKTVPSSKVIGTINVEKQNR